MGLFVECHAARPEVVGSSPAPVGHAFFLQYADESHSVTLTGF